MKNNQTQIIRRKNSSTEPVPQGRRGATQTNRTCRIKVQMPMGMAHAIEMGAKKLRITKSQLFVERAIRERLAVINGKNLKRRARELGAAIGKLSAATLHR